MGNKKTYVLDTNILMQSPKAIFGFADNDIVITGTTLQELDKHKTDKGETGYNTREVIRILDSYRYKGNLLKGVSLEKNMGNLILEPDCISENLPQGYNLSVPDNRIISAVIGMKTTGKYDEPIILVTNDVSMRLNASICGVEVQGYRNETIDTTEKYTGRRELNIPSADINQLYKDGYISYPIENDDIKKAFPELEENEYLLLNASDNPGQTALAMYKNNKIHLINDKDLRGCGNIKGRNAAQKMLMKALLAPSEEIPLVIANGPAGTGKTLLAIACGLEKTYGSHKEREYDQVLITRSNTISDNDLGFLPGTLEEKMDPLVAPFIDNMQTIFAGKERDLELAEEQISYVMEKEIVKICAVGYMRGRSLNNTYLIVDEAQNLSVNQALEIVSRAGMGTKVVLLGDPDQIDARYLDKRSNGLVFTAERMKGSPLCAQITFDQEESVRSPLAMEAAKRMTM